MNSHRFPCLQYQPHKELFDETLSRIISFLKWQIMDSVSMTHVAPAILMQKGTTLVTAD